MVDMELVLTVVSSVFNPISLLYLVLGMVVGVIFGIIPGLN